MTNVFHGTTPLRSTGLMRGCSGRLTPARATHTSASALSFCAKGSIANKNKNFGEDSAIIKTWITPGPCQGSALLGVADGVGGWRRHGVDPSHSSRGILQGIAQLFRKTESEGGKATDLEPQKCLKQSFTELVKDRDQYAGGTTVCCGFFHPSTVTLDLINIGDSGAMSFRDGKCINRTMPDIEGMTPRQLTILPSRMRKFRDVLEPKPEVQTSTVASHWQLKPNDVSVMATDGFYDNVPFEETRKIIEHTSPAVGAIGPKTPQRIADNLMERAYYNSSDPDFASPFASRCLKDPNGLDYWGGKPDDISVLVSVVVQQKEKSTNKS